MGNLLIRRPAYGVDDLLDVVLDEGWIYPWNRSLINREA